MFFILLRFRQTNINLTFISYLLHLLKNRLRLGADIASNTTPDSNTRPLVAINSDTQTMQTDTFFRNNFSRTIFYGLIFSLLSFYSCKNKIETNETLSRQDIERIQKLNLLDKDEKVYKLYSEFKKSVAGNFYTDRRLASYWLDEHDTLKNKIEFAYYNDIIKLDTTYFAGTTYCPFLLVTRQDSSNFKVYVEGEKSEITAFFEDAIAKWKQNKK